MIKDLFRFLSLMLAGVLACVFAEACTGRATPVPETKPSGPNIMFTPPNEPTFTPHESAEGIADRSALDVEAIVLFDEGGSDEFYWANGYSNGDMFNCVWQKDNAVIDDGVMSMSVIKEKAESRGEPFDYTGAEYRTNNKYSYGFFSVCMKPAKCSGMVSSFFTYTGNPWDEIDIEFLGKDTTIVQFNYFTNGVGNHEFLFELDFDASEDFHEYAFDWQPDSITWYVDGKAVYRATENIPSHEMQLMANVWNGTGVDAWLGKIDNSALPATAQYMWFAYSPYSEE